MIEISSGVNSLFRSQRGAKGAKSKDDRDDLYKYALRGSILPSPSEYDNFLKKAEAWDPLHSGRQEIMQNHMKKATDWMKLLIKNFNILFYGYGCKYDVVENFAREWLSGEDVVRIIGTADSTASSNRLVKALLDTISSSILCTPDIGSTTATLVSYAELVADKLNELYGRSSSSSSSSSSTSSSLLAISSIEVDDKSVSTDNDATGSLSEDRTKNNSSSAKLYRYDIPRLYIIVHEIDGEALRSPLSQHLLSILASCDSISLIGTFDCINTTLLWTQHTLCHFNWTYHHISTYESYKLSNTPHLSEWNKTSVANNKSLEYILKSLTPRHKEVLMILVYDSLKRREAVSKAPKHNVTSEKGNKTDKDNKQPSSSENGMAFESLFQTCADLLLVRSNQELKILLSELSDHRIISTHADPSKRGAIHVNLPIDVQIQLAAANL